MSKAPAWEGDWYERVQQRVQDRGFDSVTAFVDSHPTASLVTLARQIGRNKDIAAVQLQKVLIDESEEAGAVERCARSLLVRCLHEELPEGWQASWDESTWFRAASAYGAWAAALGPRYQASYRRVWESIEQAPIPAGWLPAGPDDPILVELFRKHWGEPE